MGEKPTTRNSTQELTNEVNVTKLVSEIKGKNNDNSVKESGDETFEFARDVKNKFKNLNGIQTTVADRPFVFRETDLNDAHVNVKRKENETDRNGMWTVRDLSDNDNLREKFNQSNETQNLTQTSQKSMKRSGVQGEANIINRISDRIANEDGRQGSESGVVWGEGGSSKFLLVTTAAKPIDHIESYKKHLEVMWKSYGVFRAALVALAWRNNEDGGRNESTSTNQPQLVQFDPGLYHFSASPLGPDSHVVDRAFIADYNCRTLPVINSILPYGDPSGPLGALSAGSCDCESEDFLPHVVPTTSASSATTTGQDEGVFLA
ncbi:Protein of unknown function [Gryllus bimaculatus]|nr:Protein of unknown function [Gryllus bimaculatus]